MTGDRMGIPRLVVSAKSSDIPLSLARTRWIAIRLSVKSPARGYPPVFLRLGERLLCAALLPSPSRNKRIVGAHVRWLRLSSGVHVDPCRFSAWGAQARWMSDFTMAT